ncbi:hypothetical protein [Streptomyces californicus]|uniref:hypothetical protein n=1 Tax=Streptomyces californicus TaxID=67351 RepID=UPI00296FF082|nr:hypothetical protein [Streptomyces californicus]MDW4916338.1 hypothetical protein [Streptomyces californicus]
MLTLKRTAVSALVASVALGGTTALAGTAQAAPTTQCKTSSKSFALPGKPDAKVSLNICIKYQGTSGGYRHYKAWLNRASWDGTSWYTGGTRFNSFSVLMYAQSGSTTKKNCSYGICEQREISGAINGSEKGSKTYPTGSGGYGEVYVKTKKKKWTADATAYVDIADDGKNSKSWNLTGTPSVS